MITILSECLSLFVTNKKCLNMISSPVRIILHASFLFYFLAMCSCQVATHMTVSKSDGDKALVDSFGWKQGSYDYCYLKLYSDSTYDYYSIYNRRPVRLFWYGGLENSCSGKWHKYKKYIYLERSDVRLIYNKSLDKTINIRLFLLDDSTSIPYKNAKVNIFKGKKHRTYYSDDNGYIKLQSDEIPDFISIGFPSREFLCIGNSDLIIYLKLHIDPNNAWSLWEEKRSYLQHPINNKLKLYNKKHRTRRKKIRMIE